MPFSLSEIVNDPDLGQNVTILRTKGQFGPDGWVAASPISIPTYGVISIASTKSMEMIPEGDRLTGGIELCSTTRIYTTSEDASGISDQIMWRDNMYRVMSVSKWSDFGFNSAILVRMTGS